MSEHSGTRATLLVSCPDRTGLVAALASLLSDHGANILRAQQHRESLNSMFFQRIEFDCAGLDISREELESLLFEYRRRGTYESPCAPPLGR